MRKMKPYQRVNHFPRGSEVTRKDKLYSNVARNIARFGAPAFGFVPLTFLLPAQSAEFAQVYRSSLSSPSPLLSPSPSSPGKAGGKTWIVKPTTLSRGRGIFLLDSLDEVLHLERPVVVCEYIGNPYLLDGLKFDLRLYALVTSYSPLRVYLYQEGLARFATDAYDGAECHRKNSFMHLTNYSINKDSGKYGAGSKTSLSALYARLEEEGVDVGKVQDDIADLVVKTFVSVEGPIGDAQRTFVPHHNNCFELYGFDVLLDEDAKPWLIEVNLTPSLAATSKLDFSIKTRLVTDMFNVVGIPSSRSSEPSSSSALPPCVPGKGGKIPSYEFLLSVLSAELERASHTLFTPVYPSPGAQRYAKWFDDKRTAIPSSLIRTLFSASAHLAAHLPTMGSPATAVIKRSKTTRASSRASSKGSSRASSSQPSSPTPPPPSSATLSRPRPRPRPRSSRPVPVGGGSVGRKVNVKQLLTYPGPLLSLLQARTIFHTYLTLLRSRIMANPSSPDVPEQLALVRKFLHKTPTPPSPSSSPSDTLSALDTFMDAYATQTQVLSADPQHLAHLETTFLPPPTSSDSESESDGNGGRRKWKKKLSSSLFKSILSSPERDLERLLNRFSSHLLSPSLFLQP